MKILITNKEVHLALLSVNCQSIVWSEQHNKRLKYFRLHTSQAIYRENLFKAT